MKARRPGEPGPADHTAPLLRVDELVVDLPRPDGDGRAVRVVDGVSFDVPAGTTVGLIGESGSGKTMTALAVIGLLPDRAATGGELVWRGEDLLRPGTDWRRVRGHQISMIFQDPLAALNPSLTIGRQVGEILRRAGRPRAEVRATVIDLLGRAGVPEPERRMSSYPHEFSGGLRQRAMIALALAGNPSLLLADEPTTALDVTVQARILRLLRSIQQEQGLAMLLVSHDLRVIAHVADEVVVMYAGRVAERGRAAEVLRRPGHPYTRALVASVPAVRTRTALADPLPGAPATPANRPSGCAFHPRCPLARDRCRTEVPRTREVAPGRWSACHFAEEVLIP
ncbi:peptide/nickel transport system ATP-binding protein/oligopeptide transport system ATP-binding protein [Nonomuraea thailandensis]|uniref:Peptide/nickel transport system ATP-binding protein/oligopeptide transport system ATP-binding protein n=1 Tax=Nonomuraea thailandensis TaxID=1188745 RepID=A0A9X2GGD2_9ACTN|nr:ABC transporter ATP-binding protein [Nonomuraea thailandensis]MCP2358401.1 peptide/nickel transport system ATP-binding protein/oligopeptide transport system ATP-binding protein [Nonomuraea thailandensis]